MPYKIKKFSNGYKVESNYPPKYYSKKPMTIENAKKQLRILKAYEDRQKFIALFKSSRPTKDDIKEHLKILKKRKSKTKKSKAKKSKAKNRDI